MVARNTLDIVLGRCFTGRHLLLICLCLLPLVNAITLQDYLTMNGDSPLYVFHPCQPVSSSRRIVIKQNQLKLFTGLMRIRCWPMQHPAAASASAATTTRRSLKLKMPKRWPPFFSRSPSRSRTVVKEPTRCGTLTLFHMKAIRYPSLTFDWLNNFIDCFRPINYI